MTVVQTLDSATEQRLLRSVRRLEIPLSEVLGALVLVGAKKEDNS
jgi:hypothetical protein